MKIYSFDGISNEINSLYERVPVLIDVHRSQILEWSEDLIRTSEEL